MSKVADTFVIGWSSASSASSWADRNIVVVHIISPDGDLNARYGVGVIIVKSTLSYIIFGIKKNMTDDSYYKKNGIEKAIEKKGKEGFFVIYKEKEKERRKRV